MESVEDVEKWLTERKLDKLVKIFQGLLNIYCVSLGSMTDTDLNWLPMALIPGSFYCQYPVGLLPQKLL